MRVVADAPFEIVEVDRIASVDDLHQALFRLELAEVEIRIEPVVGWRGHEDLAAGRRKCLQRRDDPRVNAVGQDEQLGIDLDSVPSLVPVDDRIDVRARRGVEIAPVLVLHPLLQRSRDARRGAKILVRDPHAHGSWRIARLAIQIQHTRDRLRQ